MSEKKETENKKKKLQHIPSVSIEYNQHIGQLPRETKSIDGNLKPVFKALWIANLLIKNAMDSIAAREAKHDKKSGHKDSTLKDLYKTVWKLNLLIKNMKDSIAVSVAKHDGKINGHMDSNLKDLYKTIWKLNSLLDDQLHFQT
ncbi:unnamed protein product [Macrosiphum euphorbiae]|uniref:Uncharacterized protein n=1 Tax=Macrosiphum euphorbiae TaxID=13131 RepID=A0AAV0VKV6_9HEMI|nr:unnamed protein product [Macrosiphum euphorbiae]